MSCRSARESAGDLRLGLGGALDILRLRYQRDNEPPYNYVLCFKTENKRQLSSAKVYRSVKVYFILMTNDRKINNVAKQTILYDVGISGNLTL